jgi:predicted alpha/beta superfamily hydrolase
MSLIAALLSLVALTAHARSPEREVVPLAIAWDVGFGNSVCVVGSHWEAGSWNPVNSIKLRYTAGNNWVGQIAIQKGTALEYKFISRNGASNLYCSGANVVWESGPNRTNLIAASPPPPYTGKTVYYFSSWTNADLVTASSVSYALTRIGPGRTPGEFLYRADGVGEEGEALEFAMNGNLAGAGYWDNPPAGSGWGAPPGNYRTTLDVFLLQDGNLYNYWPSNTVSAPRAETRWVDSIYPPISGRTVRIHFPRGYDSHPWKRYPVLYMQDGQNMADPANPGGTGSWQADLTAAREISQGRMREIILVGVDNYPDRRRWEYNPPGDQYPGELPGRADLYLQFLVNNVRPTLDVNCRTLNDLRNTFVGGSSMGGIFSLYAGFETNVFGGVLAMSPALTRAPNYKAALPSKPKRPLRIYMDTGTDEKQVGTLPGGYYWDDPWNAYDSFLAIGYAPNQDMTMRVGCGHTHTESAWRARLPDAFRFLFDARDDPNLLAIDRWPPEVSHLAAPGEIGLRTQQHFVYSLQSKDSDLPNGVWSNASSILETRPWDYRTLTNSAPAGAEAFHRAAASPHP